VTAPVRGGARKRWSVATPCHAWLSAVMGSAVRDTIRLGGSRQPADGETSTPERRSHARQ
jgi:hypothetical protein